MKTLEIHQTGNNVDVSKLEAKYVSTGKTLPNVSKEVKKCECYQNWLKTRA